MYVNLVEFFDAYAGAKPELRASCGRTSASASTSPTATARSRRWWPPTCPQYIERDPALAETLHRFRSSGKRLFLLTNSDWAYTDPVMSYLLDGALPAYPSWRNYFDVIIVSGAKPAFFTEERPFVELDAAGEPLPKPSRRARSCAAGSTPAATCASSRSGPAARGAEVLYIGDHIYGDMLRSRKSSAWRTAMVLQELEHEVEVHDRVTPELAAPRRPGAPAAPPGRRDQRQADGAARAAAPRGQRRPPALEAEHRRRPSAPSRRRSTACGPSCAPAWRSTAAGGRRSTPPSTPTGARCSARATRSASSASRSRPTPASTPAACRNFRFYSPNRHFRGPRDRMPHER